MSRQAFEGFRGGAYPRPVNGARRNGGRRRPNGQSALTTLSFTEAWALPDAVQPLFPVPSCVLFAERSGVPTGIQGATVTEASGTLPRRDATSAEADAALAWRTVPWPAPAEDAPARYYADRFRQGATLVPRLLCVVERPPISPAGIAASALLIESRRSTQEKAPWKNLPALRGNIESRFLRKLYLGESIAPFRPLDPVEAVISWDGGTEIMDGATAQSRGFAHLAQWMQRAEALWEEHKQGRARTQNSPSPGIGITTAN